MALVSSWEIQRVNKGTVKVLTLGGQSGSLQLPRGDPESWAHKRIAHTRLLGGGAAGTLCVYSEL